MTATDAGPLIALIDADEPDHAACVRVLDALAAPLVTTWPALTEAMYLLGRNAGWPGQSQLWRMVRQRDLLVHDLSAAQVERVHVLMERYRDLPMALADATLVALVESTHPRRVFTLDPHFRIYRTASGEPLEVIP